MNSTLALLLVVAIACVSSISAMNLNEMDLDSLLKLDTIDEVEGADEFAAGATGTACSSTEFMCAGSGTCITAVQKCNGVTDCTDGSDEWGCSLPTCSDASYGFACNSPNVARNPQPANCAQIPCMLVDCCSTCAPGQYTCADGACVTGTKCDFVPQCSDGSDEWGCALPTCSDASYGANCGAQTTRSVAMKNIWAANCAQGPCTTAECCHSCTAAQFACADGSCVTGAACNGVSDCADGSDEWACVLPACAASDCTGTTPLLKAASFLPANCASLVCTATECCTSCSTTTQFTCYTSGSCMPIATRCNGASDCADNSDEWGCALPTCATFTCSSPLVANTFTGDCASVGGCTSTECCM